MTHWTLGVIGGSGLYEFEGLKDRRWIKVDSPWGEPSDELMIGALGDVTLVFLPRHGRGHRLAPGAIDARANIDALKRAGCTDLLSISAVGSLREDLAPGMFATVNQYVDRTENRPKSFFGAGFVAHVSMADPVCPRLSSYAAVAGRRAGVELADGVTYLAMEGPQFSTRAESRLYRSWGCDVVGMTAMPEARLAREAELPYANVCMVTDYDCWREESAEVDVASILAVMRANIGAAQRLIVEFAESLVRPRGPSPIDSCLDTVVISDPSVWDPSLVSKLDAICARRFNKSKHPHDRVDSR
ncbi:S-methyl-5'-thioadenosine phosphorylase [Methylocystis sp. FS]|uniref:S-methyl-5'-thioadenosine phosphorylase n=1 Tax=Methylocystis silviterrae TaxID=2743612 RepID=UPI001581B8EA|nr:S-methyl-5'-thioadenosine phosphorylase [Methylocystis silviterrae]NUJ81358.1 S-methyl-5'-thioadenosine phosphorylase [Methylocystis silviterrae]